MKLLRRFRGISCEEALQFLQSYLDGELDDASARKVSGHLAVCERCEVESSVYENIKDSLRRLDRPIDPVVLARLQAFSKNVPIADIDN